MNKKLFALVGTAIIGVGTIASPMLSTAYNGRGFTNQSSTNLGVSGADKGGQGDETFIDTIQNFVNYILGVLGLITIIILIWGGFQMVTAAGDDGKYKKGFTIVKQAAIGLILIGVSALIVNLIFFFVNDNTQGAGGGGGGGAAN